MFRIILSAWLIVSPAVALGQCKTCVKPVVAVAPVVQTQTVLIPTYAVSYDAGTAAILAELRAIREEVAALRAGGVAGTPQAAQLAVAGKCARCHGIDVAATKAATKSGDDAFVMFDKAGKPVEFSLAEKRRLEQVTKEGTMPPGAPLSDAEKKLFAEWVKGLGKAK